MLTKPSATTSPDYSYVTNLLIRSYIFAFPSLSMIVQGAASALLIFGALASLAVIATGRIRAGSTRKPLSRADLSFCAAMAAPVLLVVLTQLLHGNVVWSTVDSPSRFVLAIPIYLLLCRCDARQLRWMDLSFALGALTSIGIMLPNWREWGLDRFGSYFLNPIHYGDIALIFGVLSAMSIFWWRRDSYWLYTLKIIGLSGGLLASLLTGSRGGWVAVPALALLLVVYQYRTRSFRFRAALAIIVALACILPYFTSTFVRDRINKVASDIQDYTHGNRDTSVGVRLQLWAAGVRYVQNHPLIGLGGDGYKEHMQELQTDGVLTELATIAGEGEMHNQMLAYAVDYGIFGWLALMMIYCVPAALFAYAACSGSATRQRTALLGLSFVLAFWIFGLTVETFNLKSTTSTYVAIVTILCASCAAVERHKEDQGASTSGLRSTIEKCPNQPDKIRETSA